VSEEVLEVYQAVPLASLENQLVWFFLPGLQCKLAVGMCGDRLTGL